MSKASRPYARRSAPSVSSTMPVSRSATARGSTAGGLETGVGFFESIALSIGCPGIESEHERSQGAHPARGGVRQGDPPAQRRSEEHTSELQSRFGISYAV